MKRLFERQNAAFGGALLIRD